MHQNHVLDQSKQLAQAEARRCRWAPEDLQELPMSSEAKCPFHRGAGVGKLNHDWWPNQLSLKGLHQFSPLSDPHGGILDYAQEFASLDLAAVKQELTTLMTDSQPWWP